MLLDANSLASPNQEPWRIIPKPGQMIPNLGPSCPMHATNTCRRYFKRLLGRSRRQDATRPSQSSGTSFKTAAPPFSMPNTH